MVGPPGFEPGTTSDLGIPGMRGGDMLPRLAS